jgi:hypothetical protein
VIYLLTTAAKKDLRPRGKQIPVVEGLAAWLS